MLNYNTPPVSGRLLCQRLMKFAHKHSQTRFRSYQWMCQVWLKSLDIYLSYCPENENMGVSLADNSVKI